MASIVFGQANASHRGRPIRPAKQLSRKTQSTVLHTSKQFSAFGARAVAHEHIRRTSWTVFIAETVFPQKVRKWTQSLSLFVMNTTMFNRDNQNPVTAPCSVPWLAAHVKEEWKTISETKSRARKSQFRAAYLAHWMIQELSQSVKERKIAIHQLAGTGRVLGNF